MSVSEGDLGKQAIAKFGYGVGYRGRGVVVAHSLAPMVLIRADDGSEFWWRYDMCDLIDE